MRLGFMLADGDNQSLRTRHSDDNIVVCHGWHESTDESDRSSLAGSADQFVITIRCKPAQFKVLGQAWIGAIDALFGNDGQINGFQCEPNRPSPC